MSRWPSARAARVYAALLRIGWSVKRRSGGSHVVLQRPGWPDFVWAFHTILAAHELGRKELEKPDSRSARTTHAEGFGGRGEGRPFACP